MFAEHQPQLSALAQRGDGFARIMTFAVLTIRMPLRDACLDYKLVRRGEPARSVFAHKHAALAWIRDNAADLHDELERCYADGASEATMLRAVMECPGIGLAKAGFILQMAFGISGCIDTHNLTRFAIPPRQYASGHKATDLRRADSYSALVANLGGTAALWDGWCDYLSARDPINYASGHAVSALHLAPLGC